MPNSVSHASTGITSIAYVYISASPKAATFVPVVGIFAGGANSESTSAVFIFDTDNILQSYSTSNSQSSAGMFEGRPDPVPPDGTHVTIYRYGDCAPGGALESVVIEGGVLKDECTRLYYRPWDKVPKDQQGNV